MKRKRRGNDNTYRVPDEHTRRARQQGYAARSVFKLEEIDRRIRLIRAGDRVLDLGAAPGSWSAYAAKRVGGQGRVVAMDLQEMTQALPERCITLIGDVYDNDLFLNGAIADHGPYDVVVSDMMPNTTGDKRTDQIRSQTIFERALSIAARLLKPDGNFAGKIFMSGAFAEVRESMKKRFTTVRTIRPRAVRGVSTEVFLVGVNRRHDLPDEDLVVWDTDVTYGPGDPRQVTKKVRSDTSDE